MNFKLLKSISIFFIAISFLFINVETASANGAVSILRFFGARAISTSIKRLKIPNLYSRFTRISGRRFSAARNIRRYNLKIVNRRYAGSYFPSNRLPLHIRNKYPKSVRFDRNGYPDFSPYSIKTIRSNQLNGQYANDFSIANKMAGYQHTPVGYTWHHHQNGRDMLLIPTDLHRSIGHSGGRSYLQHSN